MESFSTRDLAEMLMHNNDFMCIATVEGRFLWLNDTWLELGWSLEELKERPFLDLVHPDDVYKTLEEMSALATGAQTLLFCNRYRCKDGSYRWLEWSARPMSDGRLHSIARDITQRMRKEAERERLERVLSMSAAVSRTGNWFVDLETKVVHWSPEVYVIHGLDPEMHVPTLASGIKAYHPADRDRVSAHVRSAIERRVPFEFELRLLRPDGSIRHVQSLGTPVVTNDVVTGLVGVFRDITDEIRRHRRLDLEQFAGMVAHDLAAPARRVKSFVGMLAGDLGEVGDEVRLCLRYLTEASERMTDLLTSLREYADHGTSGSVEEVPLSEVVACVLEDLDATDRVEVGELPVVIGNRIALYRVFQNLISNALKFGRDEIPVQVRVDSRREHSHWRVTVNDNGLGIPENGLRRVMLPFQRLHPERPGMGMGLPTVRRLLELGRGRLEIESEPGVGSTFSVVLPCPQAA